MTARDCMMFGLYLAAIAMAVEMATNGQFVLGIFQACFVAVFFGLRLYFIFVLKPRSAKARLTPASD